VAPGLPEGSCRPDALALIGAFGMADGGTALYHPRWPSMNFMTDAVECAAPGSEWRRQWPTATVARSWLHRQAVWKSESIVVCSAEERMRGWDSMTPGAGNRLDRNDRRRPDLLSSVMSRFAPPVGAAARSGAGKTLALSSCR